MTDGAKIVSLPSRPRLRGRPSATSTPAPSDEVILRVAFDAFAEHGYDGTTMRDLAKKLEVSHGFLNARFGSKEALWRRAVQHEIDGQPQVIRDVFEGEYPDELARLRDLVICWTRIAAAKPGVTRLVNEEARHQTPRLDYLYEEMIAPFVATLGPLLARVAEQQGVEPPDTSIFVHLLIRGIGGYFGVRPLVRRLGSDLPATAAQVRAHGEMFADVLLALFARPVAQDQKEKRPG